MGAQQRQRYRIAPRRASQNPHFPVSQGSRRRSRGDSVTLLAGLGAGLGSGVRGSKRGRRTAMALRSPIFFSGAFLFLAALYVAGFNIAVRTDPGAAQSRFETLTAANAPRRAAPHGERALAMRLGDGEDNEQLAPLKVKIADAQLEAKNYPRASALFIEALSAQWGQALPARDRASIEDRMGHAHILSGDLTTAVSVYASFLELAGDEASIADPDEAASLAAYYAERVAGAADAFAEALNHAGAADLFRGSRDARLAASNQMASLGAFYAMREDGRYASAGLLSSAYQIRRTILGGSHQDTVQLTLILGPVYREMGRLDDAEELYLDAFHAQERVKGANNPDLSLYIKLLAGIYEQQGRLTEAQALYEHMRSLFRDAFGAQRYSVNRERDRRTDVNRPVSQYFLLEHDYAPDDLVSAAEYSIPVSKAPNIDEMKLRLAPDAGADPREANMPVRLAQLISLCRSESNERISLRSGYRSYASQRGLYQRLARKGTVTPPGMSEHQTGLAADINVNGRFMRQNDRAYQCFEENAFRFGLILSYPPGNDYLPGIDSYEPWHWRYVGVQTAQLYREAGPQNRPQEFLAALPCYQARAASGSFPLAGEPDICLKNDAVIAAVETSQDDAQNDAQPIGENKNSARILNDDLN